MRTALHWSNTQGRAVIHGDPILKGNSDRTHMHHSTDIVIAPFPFMAPALIERWDSDLYMAVLLKTLGVPMVAPDVSMPDAVFDAMAFAQANDLAQFIGTPEYQAGSHFIFHF